MQQAMHKTDRHLKCTSKVLIKIRFRFTKNQLPTKKKLMSTTSKVEKNVKMYLQHILQVVKDNHHRHNFFVLFSFFSDKVNFVTKLNPLQKKKQVLSGQQFDISHLAIVCLAAKTEMLMLLLMDCNSLCNWLHKGAQIQLFFVGDKIITC